MQINQENRFQLAPTVQAPRSTFLMHQNIRTTFNAGQLIPFYVDSDVMPGDTFKVQGTFVVRQSTPIYPTMDNSYLDIFFFFIPHRLVWDHWKEFWGENTTGAWTQQATYTVPQMQFGGTGAFGTIAKGTIANYMGLPILSNLGSQKQIQVNALPFRAYTLTWNEWFRPENVTPPYYVYKGDANSSVVTTESGQYTNYAWGNYITTAISNLTRMPTEPAPVYKYKDYFNSCQVEPQYGGAISLPIGQSAPIVGLNDEYGQIALQLTTNPQPSTGTDYRLARNSSTGAASVIAPTVANDPNAQYFGMNDKAFADLSNAVAATINAQRMAFAAQRILEAKARTGSRYTEIIRGIFHVISPDARQQRPEYLGGKRIPINMNQVAQTSSTDSTSPQGNVAAYSLTVDSDHMFTKSFTEHGTILGLLCVRQEHSYDQGINRMWSRKYVLDFYQPQLAFLGEQAILNKEIYADGTSNDNQVFGYNERWAEYRYKPNINTGAFSTQYAQSLDSWHYGDSYSGLPVLSDAWRRETKDYIDRTLAVQSNVEDQYIMDSRLEFVATRPLPMFSIPSLIDHF